MTLRDCDARATADTYWQQYLAERDRCESVQGVQDAWQNYQRNLESSGIVATLAGYRFKNDLGVNR